MTQTLEELQKSYEFLLKENETLKALVKESQNRVSESEELLSTYETFCNVDQFPLIEGYIQTAKALEAKYTNLESVDTAMTKLKAYEEFGSLEGLKTDRETLDKVTKEYDSYVKLGTVESVTESLNKLHTYEEYGSTEDLDKAGKLLESFMTIGTVPALEAKLDTLSKYETEGTVEEFAEAKTAKAELTSITEEFGSKETIRQVGDALETYLKIGSPKDFTDAKESAAALDKLGYTVESVDKIIAEKLEEAEKAKIDNLVAKFSITKEAAESTLAMNGNDVEKTAAYLESLNLNKSSLLGKRLEVVVEDNKSKSVNKVDRFTKSNHKTSLYKFN